MKARYAWLLNLDAEDELKAGARYRPSRRMIALLRTLSPRAAERCLGGDDVLVDATSGANEACADGGFTGRAWLPTPWALRTLASLGLNPEPAPSLDVLQRVNHRAFAYDVCGPRLPGARCFEQGDERALGHAQSLGEVWVKRAYGAAGRGKRRGHASEEALLRFLRATIAYGPAVIEPHVDIDQEFAIHGFLPAHSRELQLGAPCVQRCQAGAWRETVVAPEGALSSEERDRLVETATRLAMALREAGYFGAFGVDAYRYRAADGALRFNPCGELNARFTMGTRVGLGDCHHALPMQPGTPAAH